MSFMNPLVVAHSKTIEAAAALVSFCQLVDYPTPDSPEQIKLTALLYSLHHELQKDFLDLYSNVLEVMKVEVDRDQHGEYF